MRRVDVTSRVGLSQVLLLISLVLLLPAGCPTAPGGGSTNGDTNGNATTNDTTGGEVGGDWTADAGLLLRAGGAELNVPQDANPSNPHLTLRPVTDAELRAGALPADQGFEAGVALGPDGATFEQPVRVSVPLKHAAVLDTLPVLVFDQDKGTWGGADLSATVSSDGLTATFEVTHFSSYSCWNPPPPAGTEPIGEGEIIAGTGSFEGSPFNTLPNPHAADASLNYSPFGNVFALSIVQVDATNPVTGDFVTLTAGLHASEIRDVSGAKVGLVTPAGGLGGPSIFNDGGPNKPVAGIMYLRKTATQWIVDVYCTYSDGGLIFGQAAGDR